MEENEVIIEGFRFTNAQLAAQAKREADGVRYIKENTDMENPEMVLHLYHKLITEELFETPIGIGFLKELRDYLSAVPSIREPELETISVEKLLKSTETRTSIEKAGRERKKQQDKVNADKKLEQTKKNFRNSLLCNLFLVIVVIGMFIVATTGDHPNILSYENKIIDKYAEWQQELEEREQAVKVREQELGIMP